MFLIDFYFLLKNYRNYEVTFIDDLIAVIDKEIVWYGSVNLLSKEDAEDNLMRVSSKEIAAELLELTFGDKKSIQVW